MSKCSAGNRQVVGSIPTEDAFFIIYILVLLYSSYGRHHRRTKNQIFQYSLFFKWVFISILEQLYKIVRPRLGSNQQPLD